MDGPAGWLLVVSGMLFFSFGIHVEYVLYCITLVRFFFPYLYYRNRKRGWCGLWFLLPLLFGNRHDRRDWAGR